jgi:FKBP-type peptidyl-prolyl cis-trans isomerase SlyD
MRPRFVSFHYKLRNKEGKELDSSYEGEPMMYLEGRQQVMPMLEEGMKELKPGDRKQIFIRCAEAYGNRDEKLVLQVPLEKLPHKGPLREGQQFRLDAKNAPAQVYRVVKFTNSYAVLDGNHPLAGQDLFFDVEIKDVRAATSNELVTADFDAVNAPLPPRTRDH